MNDLPTWLVVDVPGGELAVEVLGGTLLELGAKGMTPVGDRLLAAWSGKVEQEPLLAEIRRVVASLAEDGLLPDDRVEAKLVEDEDWVGRWRRSLGPIRAGERFLILPPGVEATPEAGDRVLAIEPRMAFGTGEHATTRLALAGLETLPVDGARALDLGCGNGILSIAAAQLGATEIVAVDFEEESVEETAENAQRHGVGEIIHVERADVLEWTPPEPPYDLLIANIYITPILTGLDRWLSWVKPGGFAVFTGVKQGDEEGELLAALDRLTLKVLRSEALETWFCVVSELAGP